MDLRRHRVSEHPRSGTSAGIVPCFRGALLPLVVALLGWVGVAGAQNAGEVPPAAKLVHVTAPPVKVTAGGRVDAGLLLVIEKGWHVNANPPSPDYMIPTRIEVKDAHGLRAGRVIYPKARSLQVGFDDHPLAVYGDEVAIHVPITADAAAAAGATAIQGTVHFQACNDQVCLAPAAVSFEIPITVTAGTVAPAVPSAVRDTASVATPDTGAAPGATSSGTGGGASSWTPLGAQTPKATPALLDNPIARALDRGGWTAFLALYLLGLALNLTPCVYPMLGVTVSIFGARRAAPPMQVVGFAALYVLGMAVMYSTLGLVAAFTGGLFGSFLQNPIVLVAIGLLFVILSLSMFGLYELQPPAALLQRAGGATATSVVGVFLSGLVVGVFAAPCIGPPIVALLTVVGAKGDPWFGFRSFFTLSLGLGTPYLVLGTFSNLIQTMPRSGEWMVWVKKVFGVVMLSIGAFYASLALAPNLSGWIAPAALVLGGLYLGFLEPSGRGKPTFRAIRWIAGTAAVIGGVAFVLATPSQGVTFRDATPAALEDARRAGRPVLIDFSADWCVPCHELERTTFTDRRVIERARGFHTFKVDLTHLDSPDATTWRDRFGVNGVPTIVFLTADGVEVREARVEGFLPPERFLERMSLVERAAPRASDERPTGGS